jgi:hypothetical protein
MEPTRAPVYQIFDTGMLVQVFLLKHSLPTQAWSGDANGNSTESTETKRVTISQ